ncbi:MAG: hypothetical protein LUE10_02155 [Alistipes sp.]|nr:hypothetical protein [Alistipes sp.]
MKKFLYGAAALIFAAGAFACSDDDPDFEIYGYKAYGVQLADDEFRPVVVFTPANGTITPSLSTIEKGGTELTAEMLISGYFETTVVYDNLPSMSGTYVMTAVDSEGNSRSNSLALSFDEPLGEVGFGDLDYSDGKLEAKAVEPVENASHYGFYIVPVGTTDSWAENEIRSVVESGGTFGQEITHTFDSSSLRGDSYIYPVAIRRVGSTTLIRMGDGRLLRKGADSFE